MAHATARLTPAGRLILVRRIAAQPRRTRSRGAVFDELRRLYQAEAGLRVPNVVTSYSPSSQTPRTVRLDVPR
jgi:hypothetical protein